MYLELFHCSLLDYDEQDNYDAVVEGLFNMDDRILFPYAMRDSQRARKIWEYVHYDHPEIFWTGVQYSLVSRGNECIGVCPNYTMGYGEKANLSSQINSLADDMVNIALSEGNYDYDLAISIHDQIIRTCEYGYSEDDQNICSVFLDGISCCAGYSKSFMYLMSKLDIPCVYVTGNSYGERFDQNGPHAWNAVCLDGEWAWFDLTWDDPKPMPGEFKDERSISHDYCGVDEYELEGKTHYPSYEIADRLPRGCGQYMNDWHAREGLLFDYYDQLEISNALLDYAYEQDRRYTEYDGFTEYSIKFSNPAAFDEAALDVMNGQAGYDMLQAALTRDGKPMPQKLKIIPNPQALTIKFSHYK